MDSQSNSLRGRALELTEEELDALTDPAALQRQQERSAARYREVAAPGFEDLLDARED